MPASKAQLAYLHAEVFPKVAAHWHETEARAKLMLLGGCFGWRMSPWTGHWLPVRASLTELSVAETAQLIDFLQTWADDRRVPILPPLSLKESDDGG